MVQTTRIRKLVVANRGEIARRIFATCRRLGIATVAVYSDPDADSPFVAEADEAVPLGGAAPSESYLRVDAVVAAARAVGADAVHPGYGFLSENAAFARACAEAGLTFVGPSPEAIEVMGSKTAARALAQRFDVPVVPGADLEGLDADQMVAAADAVGWPVLVKAAFGGGGRGMRVVSDRDRLADEVASARHEARSAFGNDAVFLERYVQDPRHIEIQVFGDRHGNVASLFERECSIQRRHQKIIEEAPSPAVDDVLRKKISDAALRVATAVDYVGAGTVEFVLAPSGEFFFLEMNTRLQVEHPVTELVTGLDLVRLQLLVAQGEPLPSEVLAATMHGHAIEARLCAEDPAQDYLPASGRLQRFEIPPWVRTDAGVGDGSVVGVDYDSMLAKVIAHAPTRAEAAASLAGALQGARIHGLTTNRELLVAILGHDEFLAGATDTHFLERHPPSALIGRPSRRQRDLALLAAALADQARHRASAPVLALAPSGWRNNPSAPQRRQFDLAGERAVVCYELGRSVRFEVDGEELGDCTVLEAHPASVVFLDAGVRRRFELALGDDTWYVDTAEHSLTLRLLPRFEGADEAQVAGSLVAPMPGTVLRVEVAEGATVAAGDVLVVIEAMKMEHRIVSPADGVVREVRVRPSQVVAAGEVVAIIEDEEA